MVALFTCEAEYIALTAGAKEAKWIHMFLNEIGFEKRNKEILTTGTDNKAARHMYVCSAYVYDISTMYPIRHKRTKHINLKYYFVVDRLEKIY